ncbi:hypothetical protein MFIFM68171_04008 [Madurella fahalii]|uniref:Uncharacterized protein n=1 Tax=Madurella fahalii TaxID=1157608 RepID=A0ABQ0G7R3_9PEZI
MATHSPDTWAQRDLEGLQAVDSTPGHMLHPVYFQDQPYPQYDPSTQQLPAALNTGEGAQHWGDDPTLASRSKISSPVPANTIRHETSELESRILGLRRTTFVLTVSNIILAIALVVLGVIQSQMLSSNNRSAAAAAGQQSCPT